MKRQQNTKKNPLDVFSRMRIHYIRAQALLNSSHIGDFQLGIFAHWEVQVIR